MKNIVGACLIAVLIHPSALGVDATTKAKVEMIDSAGVSSEAGEGVERTSSTVVVRWKSDAPNCSTFYRNGQSYRTINVGDMKVTSALVTENGYTVARVIVKNYSKTPVDVMPEQFALLGSDENGKTIAPLDIEHEARSKTKKAKVFAWLHGGTYQQGQGYTAPLVQHSFTSGSLNGSALSTGNFTNINGTYSQSSTTTVGRRGGLLGIAASVAASGSDKAAMHCSHLLRANTIMPGEQIEGDVVFRKTKMNHLKIAIGNDAIYF